MADKLIQLFADIIKLDPSELSDESSPYNTSGWDSLASMHWVTAVEEAFGVKLSTGEIMKMRTIGLVRDVLREKGIEGL